MTHDRELVTRSSAYPPAETMERLEKAICERGITLFARIALAALHGVTNRTDVVAALSTALVDLTAAVA